MRKRMSPRFLWAKAIRLLLVLLAAFTAFSIEVPQMEARAREAVPEITVSCRIEPEQMLAGRPGILYVSVKDVPVETRSDYGMRTFDIQVALPAGGGLVFVEDLPRPGPYPWDEGSTLTVPGLNYIDHELGTVQSVRPLLKQMDTFSGRSLLFSALISADRAGRFSLKIEKAEIPFYAQKNVLYRVEIENCSVEVIEGSVVYLPVIYR